MCGRVEIKTVTRSQPELLCLRFEHCVNIVAIKSRLRGAHPQLSPIHMDRFYSINGAGSDCSKTNYASAPVLDAKAITIHSASFKRVT